MTILLHPTFIMITAVILMQVLQVMRNLWFDVPLLTDGTSTETETVITRNLNMLQSHPRCGLTSGGREECWWGCDRSRNGGVFRDPLCLENCPVPCIKSLIADYKIAGGICSGSNFGGYPESDIPCDRNGAPGDALCSAATEDLLLQQECRDYLSSNKEEVQKTIRGLSVSMCTHNTLRSVQSPLHYSDNSRLIPITMVQVGTSGYNYTRGPIADLVNTRHRYSWICSLRQKSEDKRHLCGATLLSMPPSQTVLVSSAHCVTVCRSEAKNKVVDNCCCPNVGGEMCSDNPDCEDDAEIVTMTGDDAEIICGEWETGPTPMDESGEKYNIILPIKNIIRHPNYTISRGELNSQFVADDLAVFFVEDEELKQSEYDIVPICLPSSDHQSPANAVHSGWSSPPPLEFLNQNLPNYVPYHQQFFKQWHHTMNITKCQDPDFNYKFPSNSFYPPGVVCAVEKWYQFCPSSGESGSPLMYEEGGKLTVGGLLSFSKGCSVFTYTSDLLVTGIDYLTQESQNPSVYTKLSCYFPWIAEQYGMEYEADDIIDPECVTGTGDINEVTADVCTVIIPTQYTANRNLLATEFIDPTEAECISSYTVDDREWDGCLVSGIQDFTHPTFKCPIRTLKDRNTSYSINHNTASGQQYNEIVNGVYCPTNSIGVESIFDTEANRYVVTGYSFNSDGPVFGPNGEYQLDPDNDQCEDKVGNIFGLPVFGTCKNNCRGVNFPVVAGGFALLAATGATQAIVGAAAPALSTSFVGGAAGLLGLGGVSMVAEEMCMGPILCRTRTGECCSLEFFEGSVVCPLSCNIRRQSQKPGGYSLNDIFGVTFVTTLFYNVLTNIGTTTTTTTVPLTTTTTSIATTTTTAPTYTAITGTSGTFYSANYPGTYPDNYEEQFSISVEDGSTISLYFEKIDVEYHAASCRYDHIKVYDSDESLIGKAACGITLPDLVTSSSNSLRIVFKTDGSRNASGFRASWSTANINSFKSPNYPLSYPTNADQTWPLIVDEGQRIKITFLQFNIGYHTSCSDDWVELNSDNFISRHCGQISEPWTIITITNTLTVTFRSDDSDAVVGVSSQQHDAHTGFLAVWTATTEPPTYPNTPTGCDSCTFPFEFGDGTFNTCISIQDIDTQPWCPNTDPPNYTPPTDEGTHIFSPIPKITCSDSDSSCPSSPQTVITSPDYPASIPDKKTVTWTLGVDEGQGINITFLHFDLQDDSTCSYDWLQIEDEKYCGERQTPFTIITNTNNVVISFTSSSAENILLGNLVSSVTSGISYELGTRSGFLAIWSQYPNKQTPNLIKTSKLNRKNVIYSPKYPLPYPMNSHQTWTLSVEDGLRVNVTFIHFNIEAGYDFVEIENTRYSGEISTPFTIITNTNDVNMRFRSDGSETRTGFLAIWSATTEPPTTRTRFVNCWPHSAIDCSQCPYDGDTWVSEDWCNGDCHWIDQECLPIITRTDLIDDTITETNLPTTSQTPTRITAKSSSIRFESVMKSTTEETATSEH